MDSGRIVESFFYIDIIEKKMGIKNMKDAPVCRIAEVSYWTVATVEIKGHTFLQGGIIAK